MRSLRSGSLIKLGLMLVALGCMAPLAQAQQLKLVHSERSLYRQVLVYEQGDLRYLCFTKDCAIGRQSVIDLKHPEKLQFDYTHMMISALFALPAPKSVLIVGLGGGTLPRTLAGILPAAHIDTVEIDPAVTRVARSYFSYVPSANTSTFEEDGRAYVKRMIRARKTYDLVMLDAYDHEYIPEHLLTREFLQEVKLLLNPGGIVAANTFSSSKLYDSESVTYRAVFGEFYNLKSGNRVIIASNGPLPALTALRRNSADFATRFANLGFEVEDMLDRFSLQPDWNAGARILTDQYSPANLLNSTR